MSKQLEKLIETARNFLGTTDPKGIITRYNGYTGKNIPTNAFWCAMFVSDVARIAGIPTTEIPNYEGCITGQHLFEGLGRWKKPAGYTPKRGDIIFFDWDKANGNGNDHTGIVETVSNGKLYTIEGNAGNNGICMRREYAIGSSIIVGYGVPVYAADTVAPAPKPETPKETAKESVYKTLMDVPAAYRPTIRKMMENGYLVGHDEKGPGIEDNVLNIDETFCRVMVVQDRKGKLE